MLASAGKMSRCFIWKRFKIRLWDQNLVGWIPKSQGYLQCLAVRPLSQTRIGLTHTPGDINRLRTCTCQAQEYRPKTEEEPVLKRHPYCTKKRKEHAYEIEVITVKRSTLNED